MSIEEISSRADPLNDPEYLRRMSRCLRGISKRLCDSNVKDDLTALARYLVRRAQAIPASAGDSPPEPRPGETGTALRSRKLETIGRLTGGIVHDFHNLMTIIEGNLEPIEKRAKSPPEQGIELPRLRRLVEAAQLGISSGEEMARQLLALMREEPPSLRKIDVNAAIVGFAPLLRQAIGQATLRFELGVGQWLCRLDLGQFEAALLNLAINGREAMGASGVLTIRTCPRSHAALAGGRTGAEVVLSISDTGSGMPPDIRRRIFEPFYTTKPPGKGTGLGLAQVWVFMRQSGGRIEVDSEPDCGTTFRLYLPLC